MGLLERGPPGAEDQRQQGGAHQRQGTGRIGISQPALVLPSNHVASPVHLVLHSPIAADLLSDALGQSRLSSVAGHEIARAGLLLPGAFVSPTALDANQVGGVRKVGRIGFNADQAGGPFIYKAIGGLGLLKRGEVLSNFCCAKACSVGWLSLRAAM